MHDGNNAHGAKVGRLQIGHPEPPVPLYLRQGAFALRSLIPHQDALRALV